MIYLGNISQPLELNQCISSVYLVRVHCQTHMHFKVDLDYGNIGLWKNVVRLLLVSTHHFPHIQNKQIKHKKPLALKFVKN